MGGISIWQIAIVVIIVAVLFGGKRLRNLGGDLGSSLKGFKKAMKEEDNNKNITQKDEDTEVTAKTVEKEEEKSS